MKKLSGMLATLIALVSLVALPASPQTATEKFLSTGVGRENRIDDRTDAYSLKLVFADRDGHYLANIDVVIKSKDGSVWGYTRTHGPWLFVAAPAGSYTIEATRQGGPTLTQKTFARKRWQREVVFHFPVRTD